MNKITMTREMRVIALCVVILEYLNNTGLIASSVYSLAWRVQSSYPISYSVKKKRIFFKGDYCTTNSIYFCSFKS